MRLNGALIGAFALSLSSGGALAQDGGDIFDWSGFYIGASGAMAQGHADYEHLINSSFGGIGGTYENDFSGYALGGQAGFLYDFGGFVLGVEGQVFAADIFGNYDFVQYTNDTTTQIDLLAMATVRGGIVLDQVMLYGEIGYAGASVTAGQIYYNPNNLFDWSAAGWAHGYTIGGGAELAITDAIRLTFGYNYIDLMPVAFAGDDSQSNPVEIAGDLDAHLFTAGINIAF